LAQNLLEKTKVPEEAETARALLEQIKEHERWVAARKKESEEAAANRARPSVVTSAPADNAKRGGFIHGEASGYGDATGLQKGVCAAWTVHISPRL